MIDESPRTQKSRVTPWSEDAEEYLLSCILIDGKEVIAKCQAVKMKSRVFYKPSNRVIYEILAIMYAEGKPIDLASLCEEMMINKTLEQVGGFAYLTQISSRMPTTAQAEFFIEKLMELWTLRELIVKGSKLVEGVYDYTGDIKETFTGLAADIMALSSGADIVKEASWDDLITQAEDVAQSLIKNKGRPPAMVINFPWDEMNTLFQPMQRGQLIIPAGRTSTGKSCLLRHLACGAIKDGHAVYYNTLEVKPHQVPLQIAAMLSRIGIRQLHDSHHRDQGDFLGALRDLRGLKMIVTSNDKSFSQIEPRVRALAATGKCDMFCVDYGGLVEEVRNSKPFDLSSNASRVMSGFKSIAVETNTVGVVPWQINRSAEKEGNREPRMSDLRDSGQIENHADKILLIHRPDSTPAEIGGHQQADNDRLADRPRFFQNISQSKGRDDGTSLMSFWFNRSTASFEPIVKAEAAPKETQAEF